MSGGQVMGKFPKLTGGALKKGMPLGETHYISAGRRVGKSHMAELCRKYMNENFGILYEEPMSIATCGGLNIGR